MRVRGYDLNYHSGNNRAAPPPRVSFPRKRESITASPASAAALWIPAFAQDCPGKTTYARRGRISPRRTTSARLGRACPAHPRGKAASNTLYLRRLTGVDARHKAGQDALGLTSVVTLQPILFPRTLLRFRGNDRSPI